MFHTEGDGECIIISTPNSCSILVFFVATESDHTYLSGPCFNVSMWPVLVLQFHFEALMFHTGGVGDGISLFSRPILAQFWCSLLLLKVIIHTFQDHASMFQCGQYWSCNF